MNFWYTLRSRFGPTSDAAWGDYVRWINYSGLLEVVSLDNVLNENLMDVLFDKDEASSYFVYENGVSHGFFKTEEFVVRQTNLGFGEVNLLAVLKEPNMACNVTIIPGYEFMGYDLIDKAYATSSITNCSPWEGIGMEGAVNNVGLINDLFIARQIQRKLFLLYPYDFHADTYLFAIWRKVSNDG